MLQQMGVSLPRGTQMQLKNVAAVMVTAELPPFAQPGQRIDVTVSSIGNAKSLRGGTLIATPLKGADGQIYALAQGNLVVGGAGASAGGSKVQINHLSAGRVPQGATVERAVPTPLQQGDWLQLDLNATDFATAREVARTINAAKGSGTAQALDGRVVRVRMPGEPDERVSFLADIENLALTLARPAAKVVLNARTGSVVMNEAVTLGACAVAHGNLSVTINSTPVVSQPGPFNHSGQTVVTEKADITITQQSGSLMQMSAGAQLTDVVKALNALGATPQDLLAILQAMKSAGALQRRDRGDLMTVADSAAWPATRAACRRCASDAARDPKVAAREAAKQFEALFMQELMKSMRAAQVGTGDARQRRQPHGHRDARRADGDVVRRPPGRPVGRDRQAARAPDGVAARADPQARHQAAGAAADGRRDRARVTRRRAFPSARRPRSCSSTSRRRRPPSAPAASRPPSCSRRRGTNPAGGGARCATPTARRRTTCSASRPAPAGRARWPR